MYETNLYWNEVEILGTKVSIYRCKSVPSEEDSLVYGQERAAKISEGSDYFKAYISGSNTVFYSSKTEPTTDELEFQLRKHYKNPLVRFFKSMF